MASKLRRGRLRAHRVFLATGALVVSAAALLAGAAVASADHFDHGGRGARLVPGSLVVSSSEYVPASITPGETLPIGCVPTTNFGGVSCATAGFDGTYPTVFNNAPLDGSFGITSPIFLNDLTPDGALIRQIAVPTDKMVTSFSSKSELALNFSTDGRDLTFMGYQAPLDGIDVSNSNTPGVVDPSNPVPQAYYREVADLGPDGHFSYTDTNAYSGNNGRAAILDDRNGQYYAAGNAGNGNNPEPQGVIDGAGAQIIPPDQPALNPPTPFGSFNVSQLNNPTLDPPDKLGKDTNFRGLRIYRNVVYLTKGSGGNGIDTVYFVDTTGKACPSTSPTPGVGLPQPGAPLPTAIDYSNYNMCILAGFPTISQKAASPPPNTPFGIWFANPDTLYVADEGDGSPAYDPTSNTYTDATPTTSAGATNNIGGLEKWVFNGSQWNLAYTLQNGLNLGTPYTVPGYPTGDNSYKSGKKTVTLPWAPATDGLRNIAGQHNWNGSVTIYAVTSTVSGSGDQGADPNKVVKITDYPWASQPASWESFRTVESAGAGEVLRGVAVVPQRFGWDHRGW
jgi:hypothetical protein